MAKFFTHVNATIVRVAEKTSQKGNVYLQVVVKDEFRNEVSLCDMVKENFENYSVGSKGDLLLQVDQGKNYTKITIEEFTKN